MTGWKAFPSVVSALPWLRDQLTEGLTYLPGGSARQAEGVVTLASARLALGGAGCRPVHQRERRPLGDLVLVLLWQVRGAQEDVSSVRGVLVFVHGGVPVVPGAFPTGPRRPKPPFVRIRLEVLPKQ